MLEDVDRIEVIRGPGGSLWGANAVNGVINIITRPAADTQGSLVTGTLGNQINGIGAARHGGRLDNGASYRVYAKYSDYSNGYNPGHAHDSWHLGQTGFRTDWDRSPHDNFTLQGDYYRGETGEYIEVATGPAAPPPTTVAILDDDTSLEGGNLLYRWTRTLGEASDFVAQAYIDHVDREESVLNEQRTTWTWISSTSSGCRTITRSSGASVTAAPMTVQTTTRHSASSRTRVISTS